MAHILEVFYHRPTKLREGNVFTGVCLSTGGGMPSPTFGGGGSVSLGTRPIPGRVGLPGVRSGYTRG